MMSTVKATMHKVVGAMADDLLRTMARRTAPRRRYSRNGTLWNIARDRLHWLDVGRHNHLAPFLGFVGNERPEIGR